MVLVSLKRYKKRLCRPFLTGKKPSKINLLFGARVYQRRCKKPLRQANNLQPIDSFRITNSIEIQAQVKKLKISLTLIFSVYLQKIKKIYFVSFNSNNKNTNHLLYC
jgi:hypothetical protein